MKGCERERERVASILYYTLPHTLTHKRTQGFSDRSFPGHDHVSIHRPRLHQTSRDPPTDLGWVEPRGSEGVGSIFTARCTRTPDGLL